MFFKNSNITKVVQFKNVEKVKKIIFSLIIETEFSKKVNKNIFGIFLKKRHQKNAMMFLKKM